MFRCYPDPTYAAGGGEKYPAEVPDDVDLEAAVPGGSVLLGPGSGSALHFNGGAVARFLRIVGFGRGVTAESGAQTLDTIELHDNGLAVELGGNANLVMMNGEIAGGGGALVLKGSSTIQMVGGTIANLGPGCGDGVGQLWDQSTATLNGVLVVGILGGLQAHGASTAMLVNSMLLEVGTQNCSSGGAVVAGDHASLHIANTGIVQAPNVGLIASGEAHVVVRDSSITDCAVAVEVAGGAVDLGTTTGGNVFSAKNTALHVTTSLPLVVWAAHNTWMKGVQLANNTGQYPAGGTWANQYGKFAPTPRNVAIETTGPMVMY